MSAGPSICADRRSEAAGWSVGRDIEVWGAATRRRTDVGTAAVAGVEVHRLVIDVVRAQRVTHRDQEPAQNVAHRPLGGGGGLWRVGFRSQWGRARPGVDVAVTERPGDRHAVASVEDVAAVAALDHGDGRQRTTGAMRARDALPTRR